MTTILITGGTGFIGTALIDALLKDPGLRIIALTRNPERHRPRFVTRVQLRRSLATIPPGARIDAIVNLAGEGIADRRWTKRRKRALLDSRLSVTEELVRLVARLEVKPAVMISGSAVGYYGSRDGIPLTEESVPVQEFAHELCRRWEQAAAAVKDYGVRLCIARLGVVLGEGGGMLQRLSRPFRLGLGGRIGDGSQTISWIHREDVVEALLFLLESEHLSGVFNLTAPDAVSNREFTRALGQAMRRPSAVPLPAWAVRLLFGEMGRKLLLSGQHVTPVKLRKAGFQWRYPTLDAALAQVYEPSE